MVNHSAGAKDLGKGAERANAWFVGMTPRRNPDIVVAVLVEHGGWGAEAAAPIAAQLINAFVNKQRKGAGNLIQVAAPKPIPTTPTTPPAGVPTAAVLQPAKPGTTGAPPDAHP